MAVELELYYSRYCARCQQSRKQLKSLVAAWPGAQLRLREIDVLEELERAVAMGVLQTPALAIDGRVICGPVPSRRELEDVLRKALKERGRR